MAHIVSDKKKLLTRIRRIKGQLAALENSLENNADCLAVLQQIAAVKGASNGLMRDVLESHLQEHLGSNNLTQKERDEEMLQITQILRSYLK